jgi:oxygen-independent coproporphyrinogen-3 oxidase
MVRHLYVHIPFCLRLCPYCGFYKEAVGQDRTRSYVDALLAEAESVSPGLRPETVFFGGGTPTALATAELEVLIKGLRERVDFSDVAEFTVEMNPATVSPAKASALLALGANRASMGVQSWDDQLLATLGRVHSSAEALQSYEILREAGVKNINLDLIFGIPGQTETHWRETLRRTLDLGPEHVSAYCLTYEEDTEYFRILAGGGHSPDAGRDAALFEITMEMLGASGFSQYEISNYARPGRECLHNLGYWRGEDYEGLGPGAFSTRDGVRRQNVADTSEYIRRIGCGSGAREFSEAVTPDMRRTERIALALRTSDGIPVADADPATLDGLVSGGLVDVTGHRVRLTRPGRLLADEVAAALL